MDCRHIKRILDKHSVPNLNSDRRLKRYISFATITSLQFFNGPFWKTWKSFSTIWENEPRTHPIWMLAKLLAKNEPCRCIWQRLQLLDGPYVAFLLCAVVSFLTRLSPGLFKRRPSYTSLYLALPTAECICHLCILRFAAGLSDALRQLWSSDSSVHVRHVSGTLSHFIRLPYWMTCCDFYSVGV